VFSSIEIEGSVDNPTRGVQSAMGDLGIRCRSCTFQSRD
jgi:hypothetical protein